MKNLGMLEGMLRGRRLSLFLDFDGTLAPIVARPELARLSYEMKELLRGLVSVYPVTVITGRSLPDIKERVAVDGVVYAANHGMEIWAEGFTMVYDLGREVKGELRVLLRSLREITERFGGTLVENKGATISVHYRLLDPGKRDEFLSEVMRVVQPSVEKGLARITRGKKVVEVRPPVEWNKGRAVEWLLQRSPFVSTWPVYVGDDETDRDGFRAVKRRGTSVFVGGSEEEADFHLEDQDEVRVFLGWLKELRT